MTLDSVERQIAEDLLPLYQKRKQSSARAAFASAAMALVGGAALAYGAYALNTRANSIPLDEVKASLLYKQNTIACTGKTLTDNAEKWAPDAGTDRFIDKLSPVAITACAEAETRPALAKTGPGKVPFSIGILGLCALGVGVSFSLIFAVETNIYKKRINSLKQISGSPEIKAPDNTP